MDLLASIGRTLLQEALPVIGTAAGVLIVGILQRAFKKAGLDLSDKQAEQLRRLVETALVQVEEIARRRAIAGAPMTSAEKREEAVVRVTTEDPRLPVHVIETLIDSLLPKVRQIIPATKLLPAPPAAVVPVGSRR